MRWLIVEDHELTATGIKMAFQLEWPTMDFCFASNGKEALRMLESDSSGFDVVMTDLAMPLMGGLELITRIRKKGIEVKIFVYTIHNNLFHARTCIDANVDAYLTKEDGISQIKEAVDLVLNGKTYRSIRIRHHLTTDTFEAFNLTPVQMNIAVLLSKGLSAKEIASIHNISEESVKSYRKNIYKTLDFNHITELTRWIDQYEIEYSDWRNGKA